MIYQLFSDTSDSGITHFYHFIKMRSPCRKNDGTFDLAGDRVYGNKNRLNIIFFTISEKIAVSDKAAVKKVNREYIINGT